MSNSSIEPMSESKEAIQNRCFEGHTSPEYALTWLDMPIAAAFDYRLEGLLRGQVQPGDWVVVPWGKRHLVGIVCALREQSDLAPERIKSVLVQLPDAPRLPPSWFELGRFAAAYYHRYPGEIMVPGLPKSLRALPLSMRSQASPSTKPRASKSAFERARARYRGVEKAATGVIKPPPTLTAEQQSALNGLEASRGFAVHVLHGITGSGKTEVYLSWIAGLLAAHSDAQVLMLVPEIALTPQLAETVSSRLGVPMALLHSGLAEGERAANWLAAVDGRARIVIGTRLAVLAPLQHLVAVVVDEEHDASFKQAEGAHYSARDLAIVAARQAKVPIVLGSATPAYETWHSAQQGRFKLHSLLTRASGAPLPQIHVAMLREHPRGSGPGEQTSSSSDSNESLGVSDPSAPVEGLCPSSVTAMNAALARGEQIMIFINRRGYAPVLNCRHCGWLSACDDCSAYRVVHRHTRPQGGSLYRLICHHCGVEARIPKSCPDCGDVDLQPLGRGTQRVEEILAAAFPQARIARLDRDIARRRGATNEILQSVHDGHVDIIVGTQMLTKGHDFRRLNLVVVLDADGGLFASDFRAPERLFATLMQVAGRAGRHSLGMTGGSEVIIQTRFPEHPVFAALMAHDYAGFATEQLSDRLAANLPPFSFQTLLKVEGPSLEAALTFLRGAKELAQPLPDQISVYDPVPMPMAKLAGRGRAQLLVEAAQRSRLHQFISHWQASLPPSTAKLRWQLEIDPAEI